jgi:hypothetical protein
VLLGSDNGGTVTPTDLSVTTAKIAADNVTPPKTNFFNTDPGNAADLGMLHIKSGDSGASVSSTSDELVIEGSSVGMSFLDATDGATRIAFGDSGDNDIGKIVYGHSSNQMEFVTNAATGLVIDGSGHVTKPLQSAFSVHKNGTDQSNMAIATTTVTWAAERFDQNADFNLTDNNFVAPVTGKYFLNFMARLEAVDTGAAYYVVSIITSNASYRYIIDPNFSADLNYFKIQVTVLADMDASDTAHIEFVQNSGTAQTDIDGDATETFFMGHLVA